jgi:hypothetical protein
MISAFQPSAFQNDAWQIGFDIPVVVQPEQVIAGGVKKRPVVLRLSDVNSKEELANFIKSHLHNPVEQEVVPQTVYRSGKKTAKQREDERLADLAMKNMQIEADDELRIEYNNAVLLLLMATYDE